MSDIHVDVWYKVSDKRSHDNTHTLQNQDYELESSRVLYNVDIEQRQVSARDIYRANLESNRASKRRCYELNSNKKRASKRESLAREFRTRTATNVIIVLLGNKHGNYNGWMLSYNRIYFYTCTMY